MATSKEIKDGYTSTLQDLTCNSKPLISVLTMLAEENVANAKDIVEAIEAHLSKVRTEVKLPVLYLIDCIIKNVGGPYTTAFCNNIVPLFCSVFQVVDEKTRTEMYKLRQTWNDVLPKSKLYALDVQTKQMDPAWPITAAPPNIHFNPKFLKTSTAIGKKEPVTISTKPVTMTPLVAAVVSDRATLDMQQKLIIKQKQLLELQQKKLELELLQTQVKLQEQLKKTVVADDPVSIPIKPKNLLLKPEVAKQLLQDSGEVAINRSVMMSQRPNSNSTNVVNSLPKIAPVNNALIAASRPIRDPRLLRQQASQQNSVNSNVQLENKTNTSNTLDNKVVSNKMSGRGERVDARFVNNKDEPKAKTLSRIPLKSKRSSSPNNKSSSKSSRSSKSASGSGSTSSLDSPTKPSKSSRSSSKYKKGVSASSSATRSDLKKLGKISKDRKSPTKDSGFKDVKGLIKNRNYVRRNRDISISPDLECHDVDLRLGPPEKQLRLQGDFKEDKCDMSIQGMDVDLRHIPAVIGKKRPSLESSDVPVAKKSKSEMFDVLFGNEDVDLRQLPMIASPKDADRPPTPPAPIISNKVQLKQKSKIEKENSTSPKKDSPPKSNLDALRAKLANATNKDKFNKSRYNLQAEQKKLQDKEPCKNQNPALDESLSKIIISPADEECIKAGNMTKAQENALMNKILAQIENQKLKEAKRKENEESIGNISLQPISDDELESDLNDSVEIVENNKGNDRLHGPDDYPPRPGYEPRFGGRRGMMPMWRGGRRGVFPGPRGPLRPPRPGIEPWIRPLNPNPPPPHWRPPFNNQMNYDDEKMLGMHPSDMDNRSNSPFTNSNDTPDLIVNCSNQDNTKSINIDGEPRDIIFYDETAIAFMTWEDPREISFQSGSRRVIFDDNDSYMLAFNEPYREVLVNGGQHKVRLGAPTREVHVDGKSYECFFGGPPIAIEISGKLTVVKIEGPPPQVKIGTVRRTDLVAGKINLIIDAKTIVPVYLDARTQKFDIDGKVHTLKFTDALQTVLINDMPFKVEFGGLPKPITVNDKKHFVRFSVLPRGVKPGHVNIRDMEGCKPVASDNENSQDGFESNMDNSAPALPVITKKKSRFSSDSPDRNSNSPNSIHNLMQQPTFGNLDSILTNVLAASASVPSTNEKASGYQIDNTIDAQEHSTSEVKAAPVVPPSHLPPSLNINELFQKLVATGIVTSTVPEANAAPMSASAPLAAPVAPAVPEQPEVEVNVVKHKKHDMTLKHVDFSKSSSLKVRQLALIQMLYSGMQCSSCGMRFPPENSMLYSQHLDWHFRQNRRGKKNIRKATSRRWYYNITDWNNYEEIEDLEEREKCYFENQQKEQMDGVNEEGEEEIEIPSVPSDSNAPDTHCEVCQEKFEQFYNEEKEEWHLRMAVRIDERTYHPLCYEDYQASLIDSTLDESAGQPMEPVQESSTGGIPGLEVPEEEKVDESDALEIIIDDVESIESVANTPKPEGGDEDEVKETAEAEDEDDDVIINEIQPERIILDEYEFKGSVDDSLIADVVIKQEPVDDGFTDIENFKLGDVKIKTEPAMQDESFEDIGQVMPEVEVPKQTISSDTTHAEVVTTIDGNVELNSGGPPAGGISGKIKINISKQLPVIAPKENKDISLDVENTVEPVDPTQPLPPGEEPVQLNLKPALQGIELKKLPPVNKGSELTGLCSIM